MENVNIDEVLDRDLDCLVLQYVYGMEVKEIQPDWYKCPVKLFINPKMGITEFSYDKNGCNAMMFRNGINQEEGYAIPLPYFSSETNEAMQVLEYIKDNMKISIYKPDDTKLEYVCMEYYCEQWNVTLGFTVANKEDHFYGIDKNLSTAICRAAIKIMMECKGRLENVGGIND